MYCYVLTETTVSNHPVVFPKSIQRALAYCCQLDLNYYISPSNLHKTWNLCNILFVILTCFYFVLFPSKNKVANKKKLVQSGKFSIATLFLEGSSLISFFSKKIRQMKGGQKNSSNERRSK